jgi:dienelactone hydrolase
MPTDRWQRLERLFTEAASQPPAARTDFLARACGPDAEMRDEIDALLTASEKSTAFLAAPALELFARQVARDGWSVQPGDRIASYVVEERLGAGGMGEVWRARDDRLGRDVAIKLLLPHPANATGRVRALADEARAAGSLNHVNVLTVHDVGEHRGAPYLVTECLEGESLRARLAAGALPVDAALDIALQAARGLEAAHGRGIVHRDLKPENVFLARDGRVKILDFGLATLRDADASPSLAGGTAGYMAPEQVRGEAVDRRADIFALGVLLYEMLTGQRPFKAESTLGTLDAVLNLAPPDVSRVNSSVSPALSDIVRRCLAKSPADRFPAASDVVSALEGAIRARNPPMTVRTLFERRAVRMSALLALLTLALAAWRWEIVAARARWARTVATPEIERLADQADYAEAFFLARKALEIVPDDPRLNQLWRDVTAPAVVSTDPPGADVAFAAYRNPTTWFALGRTPLDGVRHPRQLIRVRISKPGFEPIEASASLPRVRFRLDPVGTVPPGMVRVIGGRDALRFGSIAALDDYWIDRFEVTNRQFKEFVDQGGYGRRDLWREPFTEDGRALGFEAAVEKFRDRTGRPGPATWSSGTYPDGQADFPVGGVSWYEAAAYASFAGKSLPTVYHWYRAAKLGRFSDILTVSNFSGKGPAAVGSYAGLGPFGTFDMAGNVKEWCWNEINDRRFILGGAWDEPRFMYADYDAKGPFERAPGYGFRLARYIRSLPAEATAPLRPEGLGPGSRKLAPVDDAIFAVYRRQHGYDRSPLGAVVEAIEETETGRKETIAFDAAYGGERLRAYLFLPKTASPPYQTVIFFPAADAFILTSSRDLSIERGEFIIRSGRALLYPVYKGTYERQVAAGGGANAQRDLNIAWSRDLGRAIDYLETRSDVDSTRLAFYGVSIGADAGVILTALEPRLKASVLQALGVWDDSSPEIDSVNYAPRVRMPTLMLNGRYDFETPYETAQRPLFDLLGSPGGQKRHVVFETGHALPMVDVMGEILAWLDRYLGPVSPGPARAAQ